VDVERNENECQITLNGSLQAWLFAAGRFSTSQVKLNVLKKFLAFKLSSSGEKFDLGRVPGKTFENGRQK